MLNTSKLSVFGSEGGSQSSLMGSSMGRRLNLKTSHLCLSLSLPPILSESNPLEIVCFIVR